MQPVVEKISDLERRVDVSISLADIEKKVMAQLRRIAKTAKVQGFRPGKVPLSVIERSHGPSVRYEVINNEVGRSLDTVVNEANLRVAGTPSLEAKSDDVEEGTLAFSATFEVYPDIELPDFATLNVKRSTVEITDADMDKTIDILRRQRATYTAEEGRAAQADDRVTIDFAGTIDGESFEGGTADDYVFVLGHGRMLAELEEAVTGMKAGESKTFPLQFPDDYGSEAVAGKQAEFSVTVKEVAVGELPEVNADFARALGQEDGNIEELLAEVRANVEREAQARARNLTRASVMEAMASACDFVVPKVLIDQEIEERINAARAELRQQGVEDADNIPIPDDKLRPDAEKRIRLGLLIAEIIRSADIESSPELLRARAQELAQSYEQPEQVIAYYMNNSERRAELEAMVLEDKVVDHILALAQVEEEAIDFDTLMGTR